MEGGLQPLLTMIIGELYVQIRAAEDEHANTQNLLRSTMLNVDEQRQTIDRMTELSGQQSVRITELTAELVKAQGGGE